MRPLLLLQPELSKPRHHRLGCSARRLLREPIPGEFLRAWAQVLDRLSWPQPFYTQDPLGPTQAFSPCLKILPYFVEM